MAFHLSQSKNQSYYIGLKDGWFILLICLPLPLPPTLFLLTQCSWAKPDSCTFLKHTLPLSIFAPGMPASTLRCPNRSLLNITLSGMLALTTKSQIAFSSIFSFPLFYFFRQSTYMWYTGLFRLCLPLTRMYVTIRAQLLWCVTPGGAHHCLCECVFENCAVHSLSSCM